MDDKMLANPYLVDVKMGRLFEAGPFRCSSPDQQPAMQIIPCTNYFWFLRLRFRTNKRNVVQRSLGFTETQKCCQRLKLEPLDDKYA